VGQNITMSRIPRDLAIVAAAAALMMVEHVNTQ
jgi:ABC-type enterochelin transport system permease subunit